MSRKQIFRLTIDCAMFLILFAVMGYNLTGNPSHEWLGICLTGLFLVHVLLNLDWVKRLFRGRYGFKRIISTSINFLLIIILLTLILASLSISSTLFPEIRLFPDEMFFVRLHIWAGNWLFILVAIHFGMQWHRVRPFLPRISKLSKQLLRIVLILMVCWGIWAMWERNLLYKLSMYESFDLWRGNTSLIRFVIDYLGIFILFATLTRHTFGRLR